MRKFLLIMLVLFTYHNAFAQFAATYIDELELQFKVKQIDEFMQRFNYDITYDGKKPIVNKDSIKYKEDRVKNMLTLFNLDNFMGKNKKPTKLASDFIEYAISNNYRLNYADSTWTAIVKCWGTYLGQKRAITLHLNVERIKGVEYKWVITSVGGKMFETLKETRDSSLFISPAEHGIGFMSLATTLNTNATSINSFDSKNHKADYLSVFNYLMATKALKLTSVEKVSYHYNMGKYSFDVERIEKQKSYNKGWLINNIKCE